MAKNKVVSRGPATRFKTPAWQKNPISDDLFNAYLAISKCNWEDEKLYKKYRELADKFLGREAKDRIEQARLVTHLCRIRSGNIERENFSPQGSIDEKKKERPNPNAPIQPT